MNQTTVRRTLALGTGCRQVLNLPTMDGGQSAPCDALRRFSNAAGLH